MRRVNGKYMGYLPSDLGLNLDVEVDEDDHESYALLKIPPKVLPLIVRVLPLKPDSLEHLASLLCYGGKCSSLYQADCLWMALGILICVQRVPR